MLARGIAEGTVEVSSLDRFPESRRSKGDGSGDRPVGTSAGGNLDRGAGSE